MKIGIIGTRGIPNHYGGFEHFAEKFSVRMAEKGHEVVVYCSHRHPYKESEFKNVRLIHCYDPEHRVGTAGQFVYDFNCIRNSRSQQFDVILQLGYTSSTIWSWLFPKSALLVTNMDGMEWLRTKYNKPTQFFLQHAERWAVRYSDHLIADSRGIQDYLLQKYNAQTSWVPYGADVYDAAGDPDNVLDRYGLVPDNYDMLIARFEPENNIELVLQAYAKLTDKKLVLVGDHTGTGFGQKMFKEYAAPHIQFIGANFNTPELNVLRHNSSLYLHGHSVGGTNPSLLDAMGCGAFICAHNNRFNKEVLGDEALYFDNTAQLLDVLSSSPVKADHRSWIELNRQKIADRYNWDAITQQIEDLFKQWRYGEEPVAVSYVM